MLLLVGDLGFNVCSTSHRSMWLVPKESQQGVSDCHSTDADVQTKSPVSLVCSKVSRNSEKCFWKLQLTYSELATIALGSSSPSSA